MMKKIILCTTIAVLSLLATSCLEKYPDNAIPADKAITNLEEADQAVVGIYSALKSSSLYSGYLTLLPDIQTDLVYAVNGYSNTYGDIWRWDIKSNNTLITAVYGALYNVIGRCNFFFAHIPAVEAKIVTDSDREVLNNLMGEVYFARALAYSELIKMYCDAYESDEDAKTRPGVALVSDYYNPGEIKRASLYDSYDFVIKDIEKAESLLARTKENNSQYFTRQAAYALRARIALYMKKWDTAIEYSTYCIDGKEDEPSPFYLARARVSMGTNESELSYMWHYDAAGEIIWKVGYTINNYSGALGLPFLNYNFIYYLPDYVPATWAINLYGNDDARVPVYFENIQTAHSHGLKWPLLVKYMGNRNFISNKILHVTMPKPFRLAEQYLIRAEAYCEKGEFSKASSDLSDLKDSRYSKSTSYIVNEKNWKEEISNERVRELFMEGFRLQDLKRWHQGFKRTPQQESLSLGDKIAKDPAKDDLFVWPIPRHETEAPGSGIGSETEFNK